MTSVVALIENGITYFAADSLVVTTPSQYHSGVSQTIKQETKIFKKNNMLFGASGHVRMAQLLRYEFEIPEYTPGCDKMKYLVSCFVKGLQLCLIGSGFDLDGLGGNILLSLEGELFTIGDKWNICNTADKYDAIGKSSEVAIGSLHTTSQLESLSPLQRLYLALQATEHHTCVVKSPYWFITSEMEQTELFPEDKKERG